MAQEPTNASQNASADWTSLGEVITFGNIYYRRRNNAAGAVT